MDLLTAVVRETGDAPDSTALLDRVARQLTSVADWVLADRLDEPDLVTRVAAYDASGPLELPAQVGGASARRSSAGAVGLLPAVLAAPGRVLRLDRGQLEQVGSGDDSRSRVQARYALGLGAQELMVVALVSRDAPLGVLTLGTAGAFTDELVAEVCSIALHVGVALEAARLLTAQREVATVMQRSLLPPVPQVEGLSLAARYSPAARGLDVGGDWYDAFPVPAGLLVVVGDASGHDVAAAARMADLRNLLRAHAVDRGQGPAATLARLESTAHALGLDASATCVVGLLARTGPVTSFSWSSAGHLPPVLLRAGRAELLETPAELMLGVTVDSPRSDHREALDAGDVLVLCTDGLVEGRTSSLDEGLERLRRAVQHLGTTDPDRLAEGLLLELGTRAGDDVALLVVRVDGPAAVQL